MFSIHSIGKDKDSKVKLTKAKLNNDEYGYSLALTYEVETLAEVQKVHFPRVQLSIEPMEFVIEHSHGGFAPRVDFGFGMTSLFPGDDGHYFTTEIVKTKTKEMTLEEIEKKLGHKVKIVNK